MTTDEQWAHGLTILDAARAARPSAAFRLDTERLARAMGSTGSCGHSSCPRDTSRHDDEAAAIAAEYVAIAEHA